jgi:PAS domain-containing protein
MTVTQTPALIWHDTQIVLDADDRACALFRSDRSWLIGRNVSDLIDDTDRVGMVALVKLRMAVLHERGDLPEWEAPFLREDGTTFFARVKSQVDPDHGADDFKTILLHLYELS